MNSEEFLQGLRESLTGKVSDQVIQENLSFYRSYIAKQMSTGLSEADVIAALGSPRLLAKTIIQSSTFADEKDKEEEVYSNQTEQSSKRPYHRVLQLPGFVVGIVVVLVMMVVIGLTFCMIRFLGPLIIMALLGMGVYRIIKRL